MNLQRIDSSKKKLDALFDQIRALSALNNKEIEAQWTLYLCIRVCGHLETSIKSIYVAYAAGKANDNVSRFVNESLSKNRSRNMTPDYLLALTAHFNLSWHHDLEEYIRLNGRKDALVSVYNIRNKAAHGENVTTSYHYVKGYYDKVTEVINFVAAQCKGK